MENDLQLRGSFESSPPCTVHTPGWQRSIRCLSLRISFRTSANNYRALLRKITYIDKASYGSLPPCTTKTYIKKIISSCQIECQNKKKPASPSVLVRRCAPSYVEARSVECVAVGCSVLQCVVTGVACVDMCTHQMLLRMLERIV